MKYNKPSVTVLMSTYNGENYIDEQIYSLINQNNVALKILVRDDGSTDNTINILEKWKDKGVLEYYKGANLKPALSFMDLIYNAPESEFYAFCDQDDVWLENKLSVAINSIKHKIMIPALYFSNYTMVDSNLNIISVSNINPIITLGSALLRNPVTGCTLVINNSLIKALKSYKTKTLTMHDAWIYRVCLAIDGYVVFDNKPYIYYRQHSANVIGGNASFLKRNLRRFKLLKSKNSHMRENDAKELLKGFSDKISPVNIEFIKNVADYRISVSRKVNLFLNSQYKLRKIEHKLIFYLSILFNSL